MMKIQMPLRLVKLRLRYKARTLSPLYPWTPSDWQRLQAAEAAEQGLAALIAWVESDEDVEARCQRRAAAQNIVCVGSHEHALGPLQECPECEADGELDSVENYDAQQAEQDRIKATGAPVRVAIYLAWRHNPPTICQPCHGLGYVPADPASAEAPQDPQTEVAEVVCVDELSEFFGGPTRWGKTVFPFDELLRAARDRD